jgi:hypothetical protein
LSFTGKSQTFLDTTLVNDGFFPDLNLGELQKVYRIPAEYQQEMIEQKLRVAMSDCNQMLAVRKAEWIGVGINALVDLEWGDIGGKPVAVDQYKSAVYCRTKGLLLMEFATTNRREAAENEAKESDETFQYYLAQSGRHVRRLMGLTENVSVELL